jgi:hypothetical protein
MKLVFIFIFLNLFSFILFAKTPNSIVKHILSRTLLKNKISSTGTSYTSAQSDTIPLQITTLHDEGTVRIDSFINSNVSVSGKTDLHITSPTTPLTKSKINLKSNDSWSFFDNIRPSDVIKNWLKDISINGQLADTSTNVHVGVYVNGAVVIPNGVATAQHAITFYTEENYTGDSVSYKIYTLYDNLGQFDNKFKSFKLKRGYMATIGSNPKGLGFSKVYIADMHDINVPVMPKGLYGKTSFVRAFRWQYVGKKGWAGGDPP